MNEHDEDLCERLEKLGPLGEKVLNSVVYGVIVTVLVVVGIVLWSSQSSPN